MTVLEPVRRTWHVGRGGGALPGPRSMRVELAGDLRANIAEAKGFWSGGSDFMATTRPKSYDAVVMNLPFSGDMDADHVHMLGDPPSPGGRLWPLCPPPPDRQNNKNKACCEWGLTGWVAVSRRCRRVIQGVAQPTGMYAHQDICHRQVPMRPKPLPSN